MELPPFENARRAMARALASVTELIEIEDNDPNDEDPSSELLKIVPNDLFVVEGPNVWTFQRIGINDATAMRLFRTDLLKRLPKPVASNLRQNSSFMGLKPGVAVGLVFRLVKRELENA